MGSKRLSSVRYLLFLVPGLIFLTTCSIPKTTTPTSESPCYLPIPPENTVVQPTPFPEDVTVIENEGFICFVPTSEAAFDVQVSSSGCYATNCTLVFERTGNMDVIQDTSTIQFYSRFAVKEIGSVRESGAICECADECGGAGNLRFETPNLQEGIYRIKLGETKIGELVIPFYQNSICFSSEATAPPIPTSAPSTPTPDPAAYPPLPTETPYVYP